MTCKIYLCDVQFIVHCICAPGTRLSSDNHLYLLIELFNTLKRTGSFLPCFPLLIDETLTFRAIFFSERRHVNRCGIFNGCKINIQLCEDPGNSATVKSLAFYSRNAQEFFGEVDSEEPHVRKIREIFLRRTINFSGPPIRMKFTTITSFQKIPIKHHSEFEKLPTCYTLMIPDDGYLTDDKQLLNSNSFTNHLSFVNRTCTRNAKCLISLMKIPDEDSKEIDETNMRKRINPIKLLTTSSSPMMNPYKCDYGQIIYPADRLKLPNVQMIVKDEQMDMVENDADF
ncbi:unnamed protein product [Schistosoma rodhaini]|uniref:Spermatogenesis-associated protein 6 N-terminal domain-containing protein n=1 Tax=Schistosoma rodhaini TaxID=6188 RepID=A0AA85GBG7_9TREM|nr:unnamed protein product [Schistosoma rodhaini]